MSPSHLVQCRRSRRGSSLVVWVSGSVTRTAAVNLDYPGRGRNDEAQSAMGGRNPAMLGLAASFLSVRTSMVTDVWPMRHSSR